MKARLSLGIDLGTSNCAMALTDLETDRTEVLPIPQILAANQFGEKPTLASATYLPHPEEFPPGSFRLPWSAGEESGIIGQFARDHGALVPDRLATSAKSWLSNPHIDPKQRALPWRSDSVEEKLSPFECSRRYLQHLKDAFLHTEGSQGRHWDLADAQIVVTVPASFDEVARSLTAEAAEAAGLGHVTLLEEPQAAFYAWSARAGRQWRDAVAPGDVILVCDVGGGTADFSLIAVADVGGDLELERISVGEHILLGGDNMDLALAYTLQAEIGSRRQSAGCLAVPGARACRIACEDHLVRGRHLAGGADRDPVARLQPVCQNDRHGARSRLALAGHPRRVLRPDRGRRSSARSAPGRAAGIRPALRIRSGDQQAFGPLPHAQPAECEGERQAGRSGWTRGPPGKR